MVLEDTTCLCLKAFTDHVLINRGSEHGTVLGSRHVRVPRKPGSTDSFIKCNLSDATQLPCCCLTTPRLQNLTVITHFSASSSFANNTERWRGAATRLTAVSAVALLFSHNVRGSRERHSPKTCMHSNSMASSMAATTPCRNTPAVATDLLHDSSQFNCWWQSRCVQFSPPCDGFCSIWKSGTHQSNGCLRFPLPLPSNSRIQTAAHQRAASRRVACIASGSTSRPQEQGRLRKQLIHSPRALPKGEGAADRQIQRQ